MEISLVDLVDAAAETVSGKLGTGGAGDQSLADQTVLEDGWGLDLKRGLIFEPKYSPLTLYHSFLVNGSTIFFLPPFLPLVRRLFLPTAMAIN